MDCDEKNAVLLLAKIKALEKLGKLDFAEDIFKRLIQYYPDVPTFNTVLVEFYLKYDRKNDAEKIYRTGDIVFLDDFEEWIKYNFQYHGELVNKKVVFFLAA